jgi:hypothetical protein
VERLLQMVLEVSHMRFPVIASTTAFRAWSIGAALAIVFVCLPFAAVILPLPMPLFATFYFIPASFGVLALYAVAVRPRAFAASGVLLGVAPFFAWGVIDGLERCAKFNRGGPDGGCEADPTAQLVLTALVYGAALLVTGIAAWSSARRPPS